MAEARPLLLLAIPVALGAKAGANAPNESAWILVALAALLLLLALAAGRVAAAAALAAAAFAVAGGAASAEASRYDASPLRQWTAAHEDVEAPVSLHGVAVSDGRAGDRLQIILDVESLQLRGQDQGLTGRVRLDVGGSPSEDLAIIEGDRIEAWAVLRLPHGFGTPGAYDAAAQARRDGTHAFGYVKSRRLVSKAGRGDVGWLRDAAARARQRAREAILAYVLPGPEQGLVRAMTIGDRTGVEPETAEAFRIAGTYHVLALSGTQVALVAGLVLWLVTWFEAPPVARALLVSSALVFYAVFVGGDVPVVRATVMAVVMLAGRALDLDADLANLLGLAAMLLLLYHPSWIGDVGFQLSFAATLGLLLLSSVFAARLPRMKWGLERALAASLAAQAALVPLLLVHFHRLAVAALLLNLAAVPLSGAVLLAGFAVVAASAGPAALAARVGDVAWISAHALLRSGEVVRLVPGLDMRHPTPPTWAIAVFLTGLVLLCAQGRLRVSYPVGVLPDLIAADMLSMLNSGG